MRPAWPNGCRRLPLLNLQSWPYSKHVAAHWGDFALHGTAKIRRSRHLANLRVVERLDANAEFRDGQTFIESFQPTQVKGLVVMLDAEILVEFHDNGFNIGDTQLLRSSSRRATARSRSSKRSGSDRRSNRGGR
jgi:hypothetical protein